MGAGSLTIQQVLRETAKAVDPIMLGYLSKGVGRSFRPIVTHQVKAGGKRVRPALTLLCCQACGGRLTDAILPAAVFELIHNYSLIMDDIIDHGELRRGRPTVRAEYGDTQALLAGMFYREVIGEMAASLPISREVYALVVNAIKQTIEGERMDILFEQAGRGEDYIARHRYRWVTPGLYFKVIMKKTAELIKAACLAGAVAAQAGKSQFKAISTYGEKVGLAFQVVDDFLDIFGKETGKQRGKDILEHKLNNAVIVYALPEMNSQERSRLMKIVRTEKVDAARLRQAITLLESTGAKSKVQRLAKRLVEDAKRSLEALPETPARESLAELADFIAARLY
ncbi:MAG: polyprenyl synthetase family protein [Candidatus Bathyarchaeia archaeon]